MHRAIKFRVWDNEDYMSSPFTLEDIQRKKIEFTKECPVMQYTGLKDKNGKEIYEGDILGGYPHGTSWVEWDEKWACFNASFNEDYSDDVGYHAVKKESLLLANELDDCKDAWEVIGNIYENPELIK